MNILLILAGLWLLAKSAPYLIALFEKEHIRSDLVPQAFDASKWKSEYMAKKTAEAEAAGLVPCGEYFTARHASVVKGPLLLYRGADARSSVALVSARFAGVEVKKTEIRTRFSDRTAILTCDAPPIPDYTGVVAKEVCYNAPLADLLARHHARLAETAKTPLPVTAETAFELLEQIDMDRARAMVAGGFARWTDPAETTLRRTWKGVVRSVRANRESNRRLFREEMAKAKAKEAAARAAKHPASAS